MLKSARDIMNMDWACLCCLSLRAYELTPFVCSFVSEYCQIATSPLNYLLQCQLRLCSIALFKSTNLTSAPKNSCPSVQSYPACQWFPCGGVPGHWLWTKQGQSCLPQRMCTCSGNHTGSHAHGTLTPTRAGSMSHYLQHTANNTVTCWHIYLITILWPA